MSQNESQADLFYEEVVRAGKLYTFTEDGEHLIFPFGEGEVIPFWSSRIRIATIQKTHAEYDACEISEETLEDVLLRMLPILESEGVQIGINWSGKSLTGLDLSAADLRENLMLWINKIAQENRSEESTD